MELLDYLRLASRPEDSAAAGPEMKVAIVTNFTDDILGKILLGMGAAEDLRLSLYRVPFKQYLFELRDPASGLARHAADITFIFFDASPFGPSEFTSDPSHASDVIDDIAGYAARSKGMVVVGMMPEPSSVQHGRLLRESALSSAVQDFNARLRALEDGHKNIAAVDTNRLLRACGQSHARDLRGHYAFSQPFQNEFLLSVAREWIAFIRTVSGRVRKCIVLDLDNTLWGGVVGEAGVSGIELGHEYPGNAYLDFQHALIEFFDRGILLAINSRNNEADVDEVFEKHPDMALKKSHFAAIRTNWEDKAENLCSIAEELNIGLDSLVFIDDDAANRSLVRATLPEVYVPEWSMKPEEYTRALLDLDVFHTLSLTDEDRERGKMYAQERERRTAAHAAASPEEYLASLSITLDIAVGDMAHIARLAQLTRKTNQYNLTTRRLAEGELARMIEEGAIVYSGDVRDKFGDYGITILAIAVPEGAHEASLHTFLMSCRVMGRRVEEVFFRSIAADLDARGFKILHASYIPTLKNPPIAGFLDSLGATVIKTKPSGEIRYEIDLTEHVGRMSQATVPISVKMA